MNIQLPADEHLAILRAADARRKWNSLDDQRVCVRCNRLLTGRDVRITTDGDGQHELRCPNDGCDATPADWFYHGSGRAPREAGSHDGPPATEIDFDFF